MKKQELIKMIEALPDEAEILTSSYDDIMGYCSFSDPTIEEDTVYEYIGKNGHTGYEATYSNWTPPNGKIIKVYHLT